MKLTSIYILLSIFIHNICIEKEKYDELQMHYFNSNHYYYYLIFLMNIAEKFKNFI